MTYFFIGYSDFKAQPLAMELDTLKVYILKFGSYQFDNEIREEYILKYYNSNLSDTVIANITKLKKEILQSIESRVINFINRAQMRTKFMHDLDIIPKIGKTMRDKIIAEKNTKYLDFKDLQDKTGYNISQTIFLGILDELKNNKYYLRAVIND